MKKMLIRQMDGNAGAIVQILQAVSNEGIAAVRLAQTEAAL
jgi:hypothetical protein